jgi:hypothetical protein
MKKILVLFLVLLAGCPPVTPQPSPREPTDTPNCAKACEHLAKLGCEEGKPLEDGTTCTTFCENTQQSGHALNPTCVMSIIECSELDSKCSN